MFKYFEIVNINGKYGHSSSKFLTTMSRFSEYKRENALNVCKGLSEI